MRLIAWDARTNAPPVRLSSEPLRQRYRLPLRAAWAAWREPVAAPSAATGSRAYAYFDTPCPAVTSSHAIRFFVRTRYSDYLYPLFR
jgi:hypothetical protein